MKRLILSFIIGAYTLCSINPVYALANKKKIKNSCEVSVVDESQLITDQKHNIENGELSDDPLVTLENIKKIYLKIIENLSFRKKWYSIICNFKWQCKKPA